MRLGRKDGVFKRLIVLFERLKVCGLFFNAHRDLVSKVSKRVKHEDAPSSCLKVI
jgi:hypothetical protein